MGREQPCTYLLFHIDWIGQAKPTTTRVGRSPLEMGMELKTSRLDPMLAMGSEIKAKGKLLHYLIPERIYCNN